ncbi:MAG: L,D-transpeptidase [Lachnospiraceae bacterium]|nr:L,D-transpeptidase [Candidatus Colinaster scatohippi]
MLTDYYKDVFPYGTYINGVYCTGMTPEQVNDMLCDKAYVENANVSIDDKEFVINLAEVGYEVDYSDSVKGYYDNRKSYKWTAAIGKEDKAYTVSPNYSLDENQVTELADSWNISAIGGPHTVTYDIDGDDGFVIKDGKGSEYSKEKVVCSVIDELKGGNYTINIGDDCLVKPTYTDAENRLIQLAEKVDRYQNREYVFNLENETVALSKTDIANMLELDENGKPALDENGDVKFTKDTVYDGLYKALSPFNSYHNHVFNTHDGKRVYLSSGNYGNEIDIKAEAEAFFEAFEAGDSRYSCAPEYKNKALYSGEDDIGPTYVEVALDEQKLYYFENGILTLISDVVTGNKGRHYDTPEGVYGVFYKQRNRTLVGETYRSFVQYWIEFYPHYGLHDASWRKEGAFGGDIYLTNGSHGCVNMPTDKVAKCYDIIEKGTPVIVYSYENSGIDENGKPIKVAE